MKNIYEVQSKNKFESSIIIIGFFLFISASVYLISRAMGIYMGYEPGGLGFLGIALIISGLMSFGGYYFSDKIVLGISGARPADRRRDFEFFTVAENLALGAGLPKPKLYVIEDSSPNAFATGRDPKHAVICATSGLLEKLNRTELEGVIGHELTHVKNYDTRLMSVVAVLVGTVALLGDWFLRMRWYSNHDNNRDSGQLDVVFMLLGIVFALLSPIIANIIKLAISRKREFIADAGSVEITRQPQGLISALQKIAQDNEPLEVANKATAHLYIENPFKNKVRSRASWFSKLFNTHPPVEERIKVLKSMM